MIKLSDFLIVLLFPVDCDHDSEGSPADSSQLDRHVLALEFEFTRVEGFM